MIDKSLDVVCLGRVLVDLYGDQIGGRLEDMKSFSKYVGGSSGNMCIGMARQGLRAAMLSRVGDEHMGRFIREQMQREGVDVTHLVTDPDRLTALVILGIRDVSSFPLIFYREDCADMAIQESDIDEEFIASAKALVVTGTHLSTDQVYRSSLRAIEYARKNNTLVALDIDFRPVLWGLTGHGGGEQRFVASEPVSKRIQAVIPFLDLIVGTEEEFLIAGGTENVVDSLKAIRGMSTATLVVKRGESGVSIFSGDIPDSLNDGLLVPAARVKVFNVLGAGDAFMAGFMRGWINKEPLDQCGRYGNGCGALVVSRHGCSPAIPSKEELDRFLVRAEELDRPDQDSEIRRLHRIANRHTDWPELCVLAFDHRSQFEEMFSDLGAPSADISKLKTLIYRGAKKAASRSSVDGVGIIVDGLYGAEVLRNVAGSGWWTGRPLEVPRSRPLRFYCGDDVSKELRNWPADHAVKCLVYYDTDDEVGLRQEQERRVSLLYEACVSDGRELLLEILRPSGRDHSDASLAMVLERFYEIGVYPEWWKLPQQDSETWTSVSEVIRRYDPFCRGIVILGLDAPVDDLAEGFRAAACHPLVRGFAIGRSIFSEPARQWVRGSVDDNDLVDAVAKNFGNIVDLWRGRHSSLPKSANPKTGS